MSILSIKKIDSKISLCNKAIFDAENDFKEILFNIQEAASAILNLEVLFEAERNFDGNLSGDVLITFVESGNVYTFRLDLEESEQDDAIKPIEKYARKFIDVEYSLEYISYFTSKDC